jgi:hypothetical protein
MNESALDMMQGRVGDDMFKKMFDDFPFGDTPKCRDAAISVCAMLFTGPVPVTDLCGDGKRRFLMVDRNVESPDNR